MIDILTIQADDPNVLTLYHKQKLEFHFQQKSDNDFVMFLLDTAMRVISIVQHLAPVLEAVSYTNTDQTSPSRSSSDDSDSRMDTESVRQTVANLTHSTLSEQPHNPLMGGSPHNNPFSSTSLSASVLNNASFISSSSFSNTPLNTTVLDSTALNTTPLNSTALNSTLNSTALNSTALNSTLNNLTAPQNTSSLALQSLSNTLKNTAFPNTTFPAAAAPGQLDATPSLADFDKTISQLQQELDSVSQSLVSESTKSAPNMKPLGSMSQGSLDNIEIMKRLQQNFKDSKELSAPHQSKELDNLTLIKTIQDSIVNRVTPEDVLHNIKQEVDLSPHMSGLSQSLYRHEPDNRQTTERLQQLMSTLSATTVATNGASSAVTSTPNPYNQITSASVLNQISNNGLNQIPTTLSQISSLTSVISPALSSALSPASLSSALSPASLQSAATPPSLKTSNKKSLNPLSMLHLQGIHGATGGSIDKTAILNALSVGGTPIQPAPDNKAKPMSVKTSPNSFLALQRRLTDHVYCQCHVCSKVFRGSSRAQNLKRHFNNVHLKLKPFRCTICGMMFGLKYNLKSHISRAHNEVYKVVNQSAGM